MMSPATPPAPQRGGQPSPKRQANSLAGAFPAATFARTFLTALSIACVVIQVFLNPSSDNVSVSIIAATSGVITFQYVLRERMFSENPISSVMLLGLSISTCTGALIFQSIAFRDITYNILMPIQTFGYPLLLTILAISCHFVYRTSAPVQQLRLQFSSGFLARLGILTTPTPIQLWLIGLIGAASMWLVGRAETSVSYGDVGGKFLGGLTAFSTAPFLILLSPYLFTGRKPAPRGSVLALAAYFLVLVVVALAQNSRGAFASSLVIVAFCALIAIFSGRLQLKVRTIASLALVGLIAMPALGVMNDLSTAMLITRATRDSVSSKELISNSLVVFANKPMLKAYREQGSILKSGYNEVYIENPFLQRFAATKYIDINFYQSRNLGETQVQTAREFAFKKLIATLPTPIIQKLGISLDKSQVAYSGGDLYRLLSSRGDVGGFTTGSAIADGLVVLGPFFWPAAWIFFTASFFLYDAMSTSYRGSLETISPAALMAIYALFASGLSGENVGAALGSILRGYPQTLLLYALLFFGTRILSELLQGALGRTPTTSALTGSKR